MPISQEFSGKGWTLKGSKPSAGNLSPSSSLIVAVRNTLPPDVIPDPSHAGLELIKLSGRSAKLPQVSGADIEPVGKGSGFRQLVHSKPKPVPKAGEVPLQSISTTEDNSFHSGLKTQEKNKVGSSLPTYIDCSCTKEKTAPISADKPIASPIVRHNNTVNKPLKLLSSARESSNTDNLRKRTDQTKGLVNRTLTWFKGTSTPGINASEFSHATCHVPLTGNKSGNQNDRSSLTIHSTTHSTTQESENQNQLRTESGVDKQHSRKWQPIPEHSYTMRGPLTYESDELKSEIGHNVRQCLYIDPKSYPPGQIQKMKRQDLCKTSKIKIHNNILRFIKMKAEEQDDLCNRQTVVGKHNGAVYSQLKGQNELRARQTIKKHAVIGEYKGTVFREVKPEADRAQARLKEARNCYTFALYDREYCIRGFPLSNEIALINDCTLLESNNMNHTQLINTHFLNIEYQGEYRIIAIATKDIKAGTDVESEPILWCRYSNDDNYWAKDQGEPETITLEVEFHEAVHGADINAPPCIKKPRLVLFKDHLTPDQLKATQSRTGAKGVDDKESNNRGKIFNKKRNLKKNRLIHTGEKQYECEYCERTFTWNKNLTRHLLIHTGEKPYKCEQCGKTFNQNANLKSHLRIHSDESPYECGQCSKKFNDTSNLKRHLRIHTDNRPYKCEQCGKKFNQAAYLKEHQTIHTGKQYECEYCEKMFNRFTNMTRHLRIHTGEKPYKCEQCGKKFARNAFLKLHLRIHTMERTDQAESKPHAKGANNP